MLDAMHNFAVAHYNALKDFAGPAVSLVTLIVTAIVAVVGLKTFGKWKREKLEEKRMDVALAALAIAYEAVIVLDEVRAPLRFEYEWEDMAQIIESTDTRRKRGSHYAVLKRMDSHKDFFARVWELQPKFMAVFGPETEAIFSKLHSARRQIEVSAEALMDDARVEHDPSDTEMRRVRVQWRRDTSCSRESAGGKDDRVGRQVRQFRGDIEHLARPIMDKEFGRTQRRFLPRLNTNKEN